MGWENWRWASGAPQRPGPAEAAQKAAAGAYGWLLAAMPGAMASPALLSLTGQASPLALFTPQVQVPASLFHPRGLLPQSG